MCMPFVGESAPSLGGEVMMEEAAAEGVGVVEAIALIIPSEAEAPPTPCGRGVCCCGWWCS